MELVVANKLTNINNTILFFIRKLFEFPNMASKHLKTLIVLALVNNNESFIASFIIVEL